MKLIHTLALLTLASVPAFANVNYYVSSSVLASCSQKTTASGYEPVQSYGLSGTDPGAGAKIVLGDFSILKTFDDCSGALATQFLEGQAIPTLTLIAQSTASASSAPVTFLTITLTNAVIDNYAYSASSGSGVPEESVSFRYQSVCINSTPTDGSKASKVCYDSSSNRVTTN